MCFPPILIRTDRQLSLSLFALLFLWRPGFLWFLGDFGLWRVRFPPVLVRTGRRLPVQALGERPGGVCCEGRSKKKVNHDGADCAPHDQIKMKHFVLPYSDRSYFVRP